MNDAINIINIKISPKQMGKVTISKNGKFVIIRTIDESCFYLFSLSDPAILELINNVFESEYTPIKKNIKQEDNFMRKLNKVVNR